LINLFLVVSIIKY